MFHLITRVELAALGDAELHALLREVFNDLACSDRDTPLRRACLASLENLQNEINERRARRCRFPAGP
jgi:hypothetical protein